MVRTPWSGDGRRTGSDELEQDEDDEADEGERLGEGDAEEHGRLDLTGRLGLAGHGLHGLADEVADADAGADGREAVGEAGAGGRGSGLFVCRVSGLLEDGVDGVGECAHWYVVLLVSGRVRPADFRSWKLL